MQFRRSHTPDRKGLQLHRPFMWSLFLYFRSGDLGGPFYAVSCIALHPFASVSCSFDPLSQLVLVVSRNHLTPRAPISHWHFKFVQKHVNSIKNVESFQNNKMKRNNAQMSKTYSSVHNQTIKNHTKWVFFGCAWPLK